MRSEVRVVTKCLLLAAVVVGLEQTTQADASRQGPQILLGEESPKTDA